MVLWRWLLLVYWLRLRWSYHDSTGVLYDAILILHRLYWLSCYHWLVYLLRLFRWLVCDLLFGWLCDWLLGFLYDCLSNRWLIHENGGRITWINQSKLLLELWRREFLSHLRLGSLVLLYHFHVVPYHAQESLTSTFSEPDVECSISRQWIVQWLALAFPVVWAEDWLLEHFFPGVCVGQVKCFTATIIFVLIDQHKSDCWQYNRSLPTEAAYGVYINLEINAFSVQNEMFSLDSERLPVWI